MSFDAEFAALVRAAVREAVEPLREELVRLREEATKPMSIADAASFLGISEHSVRRRVKDGSLPSIRVGGRVLVKAQPTPSAEVVALRARGR